VDHADLDLEGDLDEEPTSYQNETRGTGPSGFSGSCDIMETLLLLESAPVKLTNERFLNSLVSKIEVLGRTGRLPVVYAEAAANHMLGVFHVKLSPLWEGAARALGALATGHEDAVWPPLEAQLAAVMEKPPDRGFTQAMSRNEAISQSDHHQMCLNWEASKGADWAIFQCDPTMELEVDGQLSRHSVTDDETVRESVWRVLECKPQLLATHSRVLVPVFLRFLRSQYFFFHSNDPDSRELRLEDHVDITSRYDSCVA
jgi:U3 small nucleolar RNA-associated protein 20